jgi:hypothetical protein
MYDHHIFLYFLNILNMENLWLFLLYEQAHTKTKMHKKIYLKLLKIIELNQHKVHNYLF